MSEITWPGDLPQTPMRGMKEEPEDLAIRDKPDVGPFLSRPMATAYGVNFEMRLFLTEDQVNILEEFYFTTLASGSLSFEWVHPRKKATGDFKFTEVPRSRRLAGEPNYIATIKIYLKP